MDGRCVKEKIAEGGTRRRRHKNFAGMMHDLRGETSLGEKYATS